MLDLQDNVYNQRMQRDEPKLKKWRYAGLILTYQCNCACEFCTYRCGPDKGGLMPVALAVEAWSGLQRIAGANARVHLTGGEPFLVWDRLLAILQAAQAQNLGPVDMVETNGYWATSPAVVRERLAYLNDLGVQRLKISCDPFHQAFVDIQTVQCLVRVAEATWGPDRVLVRWRSYLDGTEDLTRLSDSQRQARYQASLNTYACRFNGRAIARLAPARARHGLAFYQGKTCLHAFLGAKGVHIDPEGNVFSGTCSGIVVGRVTEQPLDRLWCHFDPATHPMIQTLAQAGPADLMAAAVAGGHQPAPRFAGRCHVCSEARDFLRHQAAYRDTLGPDACY